MAVELTWLGHATWMVVSDGKRILIDPFLTDNPAANVKAEDVQADFILITHGHADHVADAASIANRCNAMLVANFEVANWFANQHSVKNTLGMNLGGTADLPFGRAKLTVAHHSSSLPDGSYGGCPGGYLIETGGKRLYFAGDTALFSDMKLIATGGLDLAVLPIGDLFTMGIDDSLIAASWLGAKLVLPSHYNTWPPIEQDAAAWAAKVKTTAGSDAVVPTVGQALTI